MKTPPIRFRALISFVASLLLRSGAATTTSSSSSVAAAAVESAAAEQDRAAVPAYADENGDLFNAPPPEDERYCVYVPSRDRFQCSNDPVKTLVELDAENGATTTSVKLGSLSEDDASTGLPQRIAGTEEERERIRGILKQMDDYFYREMLSIPEYATIRTKW